MMQDGPPYIAVGQDAFQPAVLGTQDERPGTGFVKTRDGFADGGLGCDEDMLETPSGISGDFLFNDQVLAQQEIDDQTFGVEHREVVDVVAVHHPQRLGGCYADRGHDGCPGGDRAARQFKGL